MIDIKEIKQNIMKSYQQLKDRIKDCVKDVVPDNHIFPTPENVLDERVQNINVRLASIFDSSVVDYKYNGLENTIIVNKNYLSREDIIPENLYMDMALTISSYNAELKMSGFGNETYEALNKGFREMVTISLVGETRSSEYFESDEYVYVNLLGRVMDVSVLWGAFFHNDPGAINSFLQSKPLEYSVFFNIANEQANRNNKMRHSEKGISFLDKVQFNLSQLFLLGNPTKEQLDAFFSNMVSEPAVFKNPEKYQRLPYLDLNKIYADYTQQLDTEKTYQ